MKATHGKTLLAGLAGGFAMNATMLMAFRLFGFSAFRFWMEWWRDLA